jgi:N-acetylneuraminic acid mutarotase
MLMFFLATAGGFAQSWSVMEATDQVKNRHGNGFMSCKGIFYLIGGTGIQPVNMYDPHTGEWKSGEEPPVEMHHFQAVRSGEKIFVFGAMTGSGTTGKPLDHFYIYDTGKDSWSRGGPIPEQRRRGACGVVAFQGDFYMFGGTTGGQEEASISWVDRYDPRKGKWKKLSNAPGGREGFHATMINGKIYLAGGVCRTPGNSGPGDLVKRVDVFDIKSGRWSSLPDSLDLPTPRTGCTSVAILDNLVVIGGRSPGSDRALTTVEAYDTGKKRWERWEDLNQGRHSTQAFMCVGAVFVASGESGASGPADLLDAPGASQALGNERGVFVTSIERLDVEH